MNCDFFDVIFFKVIESFIRLEYFVNFVIKLLIFFYCCIVYYIDILRLELGISFGFEFLIICKSILEF